jgi:hypothetical protein
MPESGSLAHDEVGVSVLTTTQKERLEDAKVRPVGSLLSVANNKGGERRRRGV